MLVRGCSFFAGVEDLTKIAEILRKENYLQILETNEVLPLRCASPSWPGKKMKAPYNFWRAQT
jgi:hypothetical protein